MPIVKCRYCGKYVERSEAFKVKQGKTNIYYCCEEHSRLKPDKEIFIEKCFEIIGRTTNTQVYKEIGLLEKCYGYKKMISYLNYNKSDIINVMNTKKFVSEFAKIRYFFAILKNNLGDYAVPEEESLPQVDESFAGLSEETERDSKAKNSFEGFDSLLGDLL